MSTTHHFRHLVHPATYLTPRLGLAGIAVGSDSRDDDDEQARHRALLTQDISGDWGDDDDSDYVPDPSLDVNTAQMAAMAQAPMNEPPEEDQMLLNLGIVGLPNAGKSRLTNRMTGVTVSAVSPKPNTTRIPHLAAYSEGCTQVVINDTPGVVSPGGLREKDDQSWRVRSAWATAAEADLLMLIVDAARELKVEALNPLLVQLVQALGKGGYSSQLPGTAAPPPAILVLNKVDAIPREEREKLLPLSKRLMELHPFLDVFFVSAKTGGGVKQLQEFLVDQALPGRWRLDRSQSSDKTPLEQSMEVVREQLWLNYRGDLVYRLNVKPDAWRDMPDGSALVRLQVPVRNMGEKKIVVGTKGKAIYRVEVEARSRLEKVLGRRVHLYIDVVIK